MKRLGLAWAWLLDYAYVAFWQVRGFLIRVDPARYRRVAEQVDNSVGDSGPVILIPGIYERWQFMEPIANHLQRRGYEVHVVESLGYTYRSIEALGALVEEYLSAEELDHAVLIAHSKGGLIGKHVMSGAQAGHRIAHMIAVNTPFAGSVYARYVFLPGVHALSPSNVLVRRLHQNLDANSRITSIFARFDPHIPGGSELSGARNVRLDVDGHFRIIGSPKLLDAIDDVLGEL